jgi:hypothetical protein
LRRIFVKSDLVALSIVAALAEESRRLGKVALPQLLTPFEIARFAKQLHAVNHKLESPPDLSLFWIFRPVWRSPAIAFYPFLKRGVRFSDGENDSLGNRAGSVECIE